MKKHQKRETAKHKEQTQRWLREQGERRAAQVGNVHTGLNGKTYSKTYNRKRW